MSPLLFAVYVDDLAKSCDCSRCIYIVLYADDILLLTPTVSELQNLLNTCERELQALDLVITGSAVALHCVKAHTQSQWRSPNFNPL